MSFNCSEWCNKCLVLQNAVFAHSSRCTRKPPLDLARVQACTESLSLGWPTNGRINEQNSEMDWTLVWLISRTRETIEKGGIVARQNSGPQQNLKTQKSYDRPMRQPNQMKNWLQTKYLISTYLQSAASEKKTETYVQSQQTNTKTSNKRDVKQLECTQNLPKKPIRVQQFWQKLLVPILLVSHYPQLSS